jgi:HlyD family secretion protein
MSQMVEVNSVKTEERGKTEATVRPGVSAAKRAGARSWKKPLLLGLGAVVLAGLVIGGVVWSRRGVVEVQTGKVLRQDLAAIVTASGEIKPSRDRYAAVNANSFGKIVAVYVKEGDRVTKGQLLMQTESVQQEADVEAQQAALRTALADTAGAEATVASAAAAVRTAEADVQQAQATLDRASKDFARAEAMLSDDLISRQVFDQRRTEYEVARAALEAAEARLQQAEAQYQQALHARDMSKARVAQARAGLLRLEDVKSKTIYTSPLDGVVTSLPVHEGENVVPGIQNQPGSLLFQVSDLSVVTAEVKVDETDIVNVKLGQPAEVTIDAFPNKTFKGKVTEIGQSAIGRTTGLTSGQSATSAEEAKDFRVVVTLDDPPPNMKPGLSTTAKITTATRDDAVTVPIQALAVRLKRDLEAPPEGKKKEEEKTPVTLTAAEREKMKEEVQGVFVVRGGKAVFLPVKTGVMGPTDVEILEGVEPGEEIVTGSFRALRTLKPDSKVKVNNKPQGPPGGPPSS